MATKRTAAELVIDVVTDAAKATTGFDAVESSAEGMERTVKSAGDTAEKTGRQIGISADAADELGGKAGKATGALGALSSGFELMGPSGAKYAGGLQAASLATDFLSGVGDSLNLVMESTIIKNIRARAATIANAVATKAAAVGTAVMTAAQWALNAAMSANPIALVVIAVLALVAAVVLAYKKSETFRRIVDGAFRAAQNAAQAAFKWIKSNWPLLLAIITGPIGLAVLVVVKNMDRIKAAVQSAVDLIRTGFGNAVDAAKRVFSKIGNALTAPFDAVARVVQKILDLIGKIKLPKLPSINIPGLRVAGGDSGAIAGGGTTTNNTVNITIQGAIDPWATAQQIAQILGRYGITVGVTA